MGTAGLAQPSNTPKVRKTKAWRRNATVPIKPDCVAKTLNFQSSALTPVHQG